MILLENDCEKGEGVDLARRYEVRVYPTFAMVNHAGEVTDRWAGYPGVEAFGGIVAAARADMRTIEEKRAAYAEAPTLDLALSLGRYSEAVFASEEAVGYYRKAMELDPARADELRGNLFMAMYYGMRSGAFEAGDLRQEAMAIMARPHVDPDAALMVASLSRRVLSPEEYRPLLAKALAVTAGVDGEQALAARRELEVDAALLIDGDAEKALRLKRATLPEDWRDDPSALNRFAWWCFENDVNLDEAFDLALRGVELAATDGDRANILDTAAEIAFAQGDAQRAVELQTRAVELAPDREGLAANLERFREALGS